MKGKDFLKLFAWDIVNPFLLKVKRKKTYSFPDSFNGLNIGCGIDNPKNWIGLDGGFSHYAIHSSPPFLSKFFFRKFNMAKNYSFEEYSKKVKEMKLIHHELVYGLPFADNTVSNIYSSHFLEHLFRKDAEALLLECHRILKPGGIIRICVPSLDDDIAKIEESISKYRSGDYLDIQKFVTSSITGYNSEYANHRFMYNFPLLSQTMTKAGFSEVRECDFRQGNIPDVDQLDTRKGIYVEARK